MLPEKLDQLIAVLTPVEGKGYEYYCPNCGSENLKVNPRKGLWNTWGCGCTYPQVMDAAFPQSGQKSNSQPISPAKRSRKVRPAIIPTRVSEGDPCKICGETDTPCCYTSRDLRCAIATKETAEASCPEGYQYFGEIDGKQGYIKIEAITEPRDEQPVIDPSDSGAWKSDAVEAKPRAKQRKPRDAEELDDQLPKLEIKAGGITNAVSAVLSHFSNATDSKRRIYALGNSQGYSLVRVLRSVAGVDSRYLHVARDNDVLDLLTPESLQWEINQSFFVYKLVERKGELLRQRIDCPASLPKQTLAMGRWPQLPILRGIAYTPLLTKAGEIVTQPGYHEGTGYLLQFEPSDFDIKPNPTKDDAITGVKALKNLLSEFCFKCDVDRSVALSLLFTAVSRKLYPLAPLHAVSAHQPGTGKGTLINLACILATGNKEVGAASFTDDEAEMSKKVLATLLSGTPIVNIDNVDHRLGGGTLERVLTAEWYKDRVLGHSKNAVCSTQVTWTANGNNLSFTADMARRTLLCELDAGMESPETRAFSRDIEAYALEHRGELVSAALTIMQAYLQAGSPAPADGDGNAIDPAPLGSFGGWDAVVRRSLLWLGEPDPVQSQATIREGDDSRISLSALLEAWYLRLGEISIQAREIVQRATTINGDFQHAVQDVCLDRQGQPSTKLLGYYLRRNCGVVINGYRLVRGDKSKTGVSWKVEKVASLKNINQLEISSPSSPSSPLKTAKALSCKHLSHGDDIQSIVTENPQLEVTFRPNPLQPDLSQRAGDQKSVTIQNHRHHAENNTQKAFQDFDGDDGDDGDDISSQSEFFEEGDY